MKTKKKTVLGGDCLLKFSKGGNLKKYFGKPEFRLLCFCRFVIQVLGWRREKGKGRKKLRNSNQ